MSETCIGNNKVVDLTYSIVDESGEVIERIDIPVSYVHGGRSGLFEKVEQALEGKQTGDKVAVTLAPAEGFGEWDPDLSFSDRIENVPPEFRKIGAEAQFQNEDGDTLKMVVTHVDAGTVTLDGNHPFAGKTVVFHVTVENVREATDEERLTGQVVQPLSNQIH